MNFIKHEYILVTVLILVGLGLNIFLTAYTTFWIDESMVVNLSYESNSKIISELLTKEAHPPAYYFLIKIIRIIFGDREMYFRLFSSLYFVLTGFYIYLFGREIGGRSSGLIALVFWSSNYFLLFYSKQARPYSLLAFLSIASAYYLCMLLKKYRTKYAVYYIVITVLGLYTNYWFTLLLLAQLIVLFKEKNIKVWSALIGAGLLFMPWAIIYLSRFNNYGIGQWIERPGLASIWESLGYFGWGQWLIIIPGIVCGVISAVVNNNLNFKKLWLLLIYFLVPIGLAFGISQFVPIYTPGRREIVLAPIFIVMLAYLFSRIENRKWQIGISILLILFTFQTALNFNAQAQEWQSSDLSVIQEIKSEIKSGDYIILYGLTNTNYNYYARRLGINNDKIYFPVNMKFNQNSLGPIQEISFDSDKLKTNIQILKEKIDGVEHANFFVLITNDAASAVLITSLDGNLKKIKEIIPQKPHMPTWIDRVVVYEK